MGKVVLRTGRGWLATGMEITEGDEHGIKTQQLYQKNIKEALDFFTEVWTHTYTSVYTCIFWTELMLMVPAKPISADTKQRRSLEGVLLAPIMKPSNPDTETLSS